MSPVNAWRPRSCTSLIAKLRSLKCMTSRSVRGGAEKALTLFANLFRQVVHIDCLIRSHIGHTAHNGTGCGELQHVKPSSVTAWSTLHPCCQRVLFQVFSQSKAPLQRAKSSRGLPMQERVFCEGNATDLLSSANLPKGRRPAPPCRRSRQHSYSTSRACLFKDE